MVSARQSSSTLSRSSLSKFSSSVWFAVKKLVGGSCLGSPTTTTLSPRAMAPTASAVGSCEASSNTTMSNFGKVGSMYCATEMGDMSIHGHILRSRLGMLSKSLRMGILRPPLRIAFCSTDTSDEPAPALMLGIFAESFALSSCTVSSSKVFSVSR